MTTVSRTRSHGHRVTLPAAALSLLLFAPPLSGEPASGARQAPTASAHAIAGDVEHGRALFATHQCWACHGYTGETGTRLIQDNGTFVARLFSVTTFINYIRAPRPADPPPRRSVTTMPSYGVNSLSDQHAADLYAYIRTFTPTQPPLDHIPLLKDMLTEGGWLRR